MLLLKSKTVKKMKASDWWMHQIELHNREAAGSVAIKHRFTRGR